MLRGLDVVAHQQQSRAERRVADPAARIDARAEQKAEMIGARRPVQRRRHRPARASPMRPRARISGRPLTTKARLRPVSGATSATVASATRSSPSSRSGASRARSEAALAQRAVERDQRDEDHARAQSAPRPDTSSCRLGLTTMRIGQESPAPDDDRARSHRDRAGAPRQAARNSSCRNRRVTRSVAPRAGQARGSPRVGAIAFDDPVRNMDQMRRAAIVGQEIRQKRRGSRRHRHRNRRKWRSSLPPRSPRQPRGRRIHVGEAGRIRQELTQSRVEIGNSLVNGDPPPREHPRQKIGEAMMLHHGKRLRLSGRIEPRAPGPPKGGAGDA